MKLTPQHLEILDLADGFASTEIAPHAESWDAAGRLPDDLWSQLAEMGFTAMVTPEDQGGLELGELVYHDVIASIARADASAAFAVGAQNAVTQTLSRVDAEAFSELLGQTAAGEARIAAAVREGDLDPDAAAFLVEARDGKLSGTKSWVVGAGRADLFFVIAKEGEGSSAFLVEATDRVRTGPRKTTMGLSALELSSVEFDQAPGRRVGEAGDGSRILALWSIFQRLALAAVAVGIAEASRAHAIRYAGEREQFGRALARFDAIQAKLGDVDARTRAARALLRDSVDRLGTPDEARAADAARLFAGETAMFASDEAVQIFGGYGYMRDYPVERLMRDAKGCEVLGGTNESLRRLLAGGLLNTGA